MKHTPLVLAALAPLVVVAGNGNAQKDPTVDQQKLQNTVPVTEVTGKDVLTRDGRDVGDVEDVLLGQDGRVMSLIVKRQDDAAGGAGAAQSPEVFGESGASESDYARIDWSEVDYDTQEDAVRLNGSGADMQTVQYDADRRVRGEGFVRATQLVGMDVRLSDNESYGEIGDVLIDADTGKAAAIVIDSGGFFSSETHAVPVDFGNVNSQEDEVTLRYSEQQFENAEEVDIDAITDQT